MKTKTTKNGLAELSDALKLAASCSVVATCILCLLSAALPALQHTMTTMAMLSCVMGLLSIGAASVLDATDKKHYRQ